VKFKVEKSFERDTNRIKDKKLLQRLKSCIAKLEKADNITGIPHIKKIEGFDSFYRIKIGDYRLGIELSPNNEAILIRFLHRKDIYRYFPRR